MKRQALNPYRRYKLLYTAAHSVIELLNKYGMVDTHITTENYEIFSKKDIIRKFNRFINYKSDFIPLERITINQYVSSASCVNDFENPSRLRPPVH